MQKFSDMKKFSTLFLLSFMLITAKAQDQTKSSMENQAKKSDDYTTEIITIAVFVASTAALLWYSSKKEKGSHAHAA